MTAADAFASEIQPLLHLNPYWAGVSHGHTSMPDPLNAEGEKIVGSQDQGVLTTFSGAFKKALHFANPFGAWNPVTDAVAHATTQVSDASKKAIDAASDAVHSAGSGITSGFRWVVIGLFLLAALYVFSILSPFLPRRA